MENRKKPNNNIITYEELLTELDKYRTSTIVLTDKQVDFIKRCREPKRKVSIAKMIELWERLGWEKLNIGAMRRRVILALKGIR